MAERREQTQSLTGEDDAVDQHHMHKSRVVQRIEETGRQVMKNSKVQTS